MTIDVAGGTYREICSESCLGAAWDELYGSGFRSAVLLKRFGADVRFSTIVGADQSDALAQLASAHGIALSSVLRTNETISFSYFHGLSRPLIDPQPWVREEKIVIQVKGDSVLRFGMLDGDARVEAKRAVYDPQSTFDPRPFSENGSIAQELAVIANYYEGSRLTGKVKPLDIAKALVANGAAAAVIKLGARGAIVFAAGRADKVPAYRSTRVFPIGSGDAFSAAFAFSWLAEGIDAMAAADKASRFAAEYCSDPKHSRDPADTDTLRAISAPPEGRVPRVYLAGPFFTTAQRWLVTEARDALRHVGVDVFSPFHDVGSGSAEDVVSKDLAGLAECDAVFAIIDGFDPGTVFEVGYSAKDRRPVVAFVQNAPEEPLKMLTGTGAKVIDDFVSAIYEVAWTALEHADQSQ